jgi:diguanylate cyclase (GGDEF)-like protein
VAAMLGLDAMAVVGAVFLALRLGLAPPDPMTTLLLTVMVGALEMLVVDLPYVGFASLSVVGVIALAVLQGPQWAVLASALAVVVRESFRGRGDRLDRIDSASMSFVPSAASALAYWAVGGVPSGGAFLGLDQWLAVVAATVAYGAVDAVMAMICGGALGAERRKVWSAVRRRLRLFGLALVPLGWGTALLLRLASPSGGYDYWLMLVPLLPLAAFHRALRYVVQDDVLKDLGNVDDAVGRMREELLEFKNQNRALMADLHKRVDEIAILRDMGQQLGASADLNKTLEIVISMIRKLLIYQSCVIYLVDARNMLVPARCVSPYADVIELSPLLQLEESMVNLVMQSKKPVLVSDMQGDSEGRIFNDEKSIMCVPLIVKDGIIGVIYVGTLRPGTYNDDHVHMLETLANPAAIAIRSAQFYEMQEERLYQEMILKEREQEQANQFKVLFSLGSDLNRAVKLDEILDIILKNITQLVPCQSCIIFQCKEGEMLAKKASSPYGALFTNFAVRIDDEDSLDGENVLAWVALNKRHLILSDARESRFASLIQRERSVIIVPLLAEDEVIGEVYVGSAEPGVYDDAMLNLCTMVSAQAALAIQKALLFEKTEGLAITDGVTGLYTHRYFQERLSEEVRWAERYGRPLALVMVDTDHFKKFNDTLGHPEGDKLLKEISALLRSYTRESDLVCRYGGDEFSLILKDTDKESALKTAERIRDAFQLRFGKLPVKVTSSIGVATFPGDARTKTELVAGADAALYRSKQGGRNRVSGASPLEPLGR